MIKKKEKRIIKKVIAGWREWAQLPELGVEMIKVKVDTGAKTSSLHAFDVSTFTHMGIDWVQFDVHPIQDNDLIKHTCACPIVDYRWITSSTGQAQKRFIILSNLKMGEFSHRIEISLANRDEMGFRMLLGRTALKGHILVDPSHSFLLGHKAH
ncbi:MAG: ATP-dependent zinc protease [Alphaproteobacteria bacterium]|nr:ATP-dependent zinc protease [Alphaproteobacteria bacterium]